jgi:hypothetical protein
VVNEYWATAVCKPPKTTIPIKSSEWNISPRTIRMGRAKRPRDIQGRST